MHVRTLILGGGLAGISTAYHLEQLGQTDYLVLEKENEPGGLCRSKLSRGFTFDYSGHLLHLHTPYGKKLVCTLLKNQLRRLPRRAWIYTQNARVPFPFQAHLWALPAHLQQKCLAGLLQAAKTPKDTSTRNFKDWCLHAFGTGIYQVFMRPYNTKLWGCPPQQLTSEWCGPFVPTPSLQEIRQSVRRRLSRPFGYNTHFYYPKTGGCGALVHALARHVSHLQTATTVTQIDLAQKTVRANGKTISFDFLVNTLPLPVFLRLLKNSPALTSLADRLSWQAVTVYQLALQGRRRPFSWIYFPDETEPFYRVGMQSSFSPNNAPKGSYSLYVELPGLIKPGRQQEDKIYQALLRKNVIRPTDKKLFSFWQPIPYAYVRYDKKRTATVRRIQQMLEKHQCFCAGRYGLWEYSFMESALLQGQALAQKLV